MIKEFALQAAEQLKRNDFKASNGWLESFKKRHYISQGLLSGERRDVDQTEASNFKSKLPEICLGYEPRDVFNTDESGCFYRQLPSRSLVAKGEDLAAGKLAKERVSALLTTSMLGEKVYPLIIGKAENPDCFKHVKAEDFNVNYAAQSSAWMSEAIFSNWLDKLNQKMTKEARKILLFMDN